MGGATSQTCDVSHCGLPEVSSAHLAQRLKVLLAHAVRLRRHAAVLLPLLTLCENISTRKSHTVSFCHENMLCVCLGLIRCQTPVLLQHCEVGEQAFMVELLEL